MKTQNQTTAARLLELVFEGHHIRSFVDNGDLHGHAKDYANAIGLSKYRDAIANHLDPDEVRLVSITSGQQVRKVMFLTQTGMLALVMCSRKPAARRVRRWITGTVIPEIMRTGTFVDGATPAQRLQALCRRAREERKALLAQQTEEAAASGLVTLRAFRLAQDIPARDVPAISRRLQHLAKVYGVEQEKRYIAGHPSNPVNVWPVELVRNAVESTIPKLPFYEETEAAP